MRAQRTDIPASERYRMAVGRWIRFILREPNALLAGSLWFIFTCLPMVTVGPARLALAHYMLERERGIKIRWKDSCAFAFRGLGTRGWLMGLSDLLALLLAGGCFIGVTQGELPIQMRALYALLLIVDVFYLLTGLFRYPAQCSEPEAKVGLMMARGFLMGLDNLGFTLLFACVQLLALILCCLTGVGVFVLFPAVSSLIAAIAYEEMADQYREQGE